MTPTTLSREAVLDALRRVPAPGTDRDVVALGYVRDVPAEPAAPLHLVLELPVPLTPARQRLAATCREALAQLLPPGPADARGGRDPAGDAVTVELRSRIPTCFPADGQPGLAPGVKNFIAVGSGKGGVGKSTIAASLACGLARAGARAGLLDCDVYGPSVPLLVGVTREQFMADMQRRHDERRSRNETTQDPDGPQLDPFVAHGVKTMSIGYLVDPEKAAIWRGPMVHGAVQQLLRDVAWGELDYLVIDLPPGTGDVQLTLSQTIPLAGGVIVCTPQPVALADARKAVDLFRTTRTEVLGLVENMGYHVCPGCGARDDVFGSGGAQAAAAEWKVPFLGALPLDTRVRESGDRGVPLLAADEGGPLADALWGVVDRLTAVVADKVRARPRTLPITRS